MTQNAVNMYVQDYAVQVVAKRKLLQGSITQEHKVLLGDCTLSLLSCVAYRHSATGQATLPLRVNLPEGMGGFLAYVWLIMGHCHYY